MEAMESTRITVLLGELENIVQSSTVGNKIEPVWDGTLIGKTRITPLVKMGFVEECHEYYFPTALGLAVYKTFLTESLFALKDFAYSKFLEGKKASGTFTEMRIETERKDKNAKV